jgi:4a-hydroxytetrahydrobiopterin dehydratase
MQLINKKCKPCEGGVPKLTAHEVNRYNLQLKHPWTVVDDLKISKEFHFKDYLHTLIFVNRLAEIAENEGPHPVMHVYFSKVQIELWTHAVLGLSENDFILAAKTDDLFDHL